jgi:PAS domain S-box-containing protein
VSEQPGLDPALLRAVVRTTTDAVVSIDEDGLITGWNPAATALFGWPAEEVVGRSLADVLVPPELRDAHRAGLRRYVDTRVSRVAGRPLALTALCRDGWRVAVQITIWPSEDHRDSCVRFHAFFRELTESAAQRARLEHSRAQYLRLAAAAPRASFSHRMDPTGVATTAFVPGGTDLVLGLPADDEVDLEQLVHPDDRAGFGIALDVSRGDLSLLTWEGRLVLPGGPARTVLVTASPIALEDGWTQWDGLVLDVTAEDAAHRVIAEQARRGELLTQALDAVVAEVPRGVVVCDHAGVVVAASPTGRAALDPDADRLPPALLAAGTPLHDLDGQLLGHVVRTDS